MALSGGSGVAVGNGAGELEGDAAGAEGRADPGELPKPDTAITKRTKKKETRNNGWIKVCTFYLHVPPAGGPES